MLPAILLPIALAVLTLGVPLVTLGRWLYLGGTEIWRIEVGSAFLQTIVLAIVGGVLATIAAAPMAWLSVRAPGRFQRVLEACHYYVGSLPGVVVALALVTITVRLVLPLYQTFATLLVAYVLLFLPRAMTSKETSRTTGFQSPSTRKEVVRFRTERTGEAGAEETSLMMPSQKFGIDRPVSAMMLAI